MTLGPRWSVPLSLEPSKECGGRKELFTPRVSAPRSRAVPVRSGVGPRPPSLPPPEGRSWGPVESVHESVDR